MPKRDPETQEKLLEVATEVFYEKGFYGTRMQEIADRAGLNKAMLHYYFRNKQTLFDAVFEKALSVLQPALVEFFTSDAPLVEKVSQLIDDYTRALVENPHVPVFLLSELRMHPDKMTMVTQELPFDAGLVLEQINSEVEQGNIRPIDPHHFLVHLYSCCVFPFVSSAFWQGRFNMNLQEYNAILLGRKQSLMDMFWYSLQVEAV